MLQFEWIDWQLQMNIPALNHYKNNKYLMNKSKCEYHYWQRIEEPLYNNPK